MLVLITRPDPAATAAAVRGMGFEPVLAPMLTIAAVPAVLPDPAMVQAVLVTSGNALPGLMDFRASRMLAVGTASAERARGLGFVDVLDADGDAAALAALAVACCDPAGLPLLLAAGEGRGDALAGMLRAAGFRVLRASVYAAQPVAVLPAVAWAGVGAALFFSAETARVFVRLAGGVDVSRIEALAIGAEAAGVLAGLKWRRIRVAVRPTQEDMLAMLT
jgi:uroporphyrinogen-III synthase